MPLKVKQVDLGLARLQRGDCRIEVGARRALAAPEVKGPLAIGRQLDQVKPRQPARDALHQAQLQTGGGQRASICWLKGSSPSALA